MPKRWEGEGGEGNHKMPLPGRDFSEIKCAFHSVQGILSSRNSGTGSSIVFLTTVFLLAMHPEDIISPTIIYYILYNIYFVCTGSATDTTIIIL